MSLPVPIYTKLISLANPFITIAKKALNIPVRSPFFQVSPMYLYMRASILIEDEFEVFLENALNITDVVNISAFLFSESSEEFCKIINHHNMLKLNMVSKKIIKFTNKLMETLLLINAPHLTSSIVMFDMIEIVNNPNHEACVVMEQICSQPNNSVWRIIALTIKMHMLLAKLYQYKFST